MQLELSARRATVEVPQRQLHVIGASGVYSKERATSSCGKPGHTQLQLAPNRLNMTTLLSEEWVQCYYQDMYRIEIYLYTYTFVSVCCSKVVTIAMAINHPKADGLAAGACQESANSGTKRIEKEYCLGNTRGMNLYVLDCHTVRFADSS